MTSLTRTLALVAVVLGLGVSTALAQDQEYAQMYDQARETARAAQQLEETDFEEAAAQYAEGYRLAAEAADLAEEEGQLDHADQIREFGAQLAYRAGKVLFDNEQLEEAIEHFEFGTEIAPTVQANHQGIRAAEQAMRQGPVVEASQALNEGNAAEALSILEDAEENANVYFYRAEAHMQLNQYDQALASAQAALDEGELNSDRTSRLYLTIGEVHMAQGNEEEARQALQTAANQGTPSIRERAQALLDRL